MKLKENECSKCPQCDQIYFDTLGIKSKSCTLCKIPTVREPYYTRWRIERFAFLYTLSLILSIFFFFALNWEKAAVGKGSVVFLFTIVFPGFLIGIYYMINEYFSGSNSSKKEHNIFKEIFLLSAVPTKNKMAFSWHKYFNEGIHFIGILIIFVFLGAGIIVVGKLFN